MKTIKRVLVMSIFLAGIIVNAKNIDPKPAMEITSINSENLQLHISTFQSNTKITIKDMRGVELHSENLLKGKNYRKTYDISQLPVGDYYMKIMDEESTKVYLFNRNEVKLILDEKNDSLKIQLEALAIL